LAEFVAFVDFGMLDIDSLAPCDGSSVSGIRLGFTRRNFLESGTEVIMWAELIKKLGYALYLQGVNTPGYSDRELLSVIDMVNVVEPHSFGVVDTYGTMDLDDLRRVFSLVNHNVRQDIQFDFHSHNNFMLSFALAQEMIGMSSGKRGLIVDATLNGIGKSAGNLNTELIANYLCSKVGQHYWIDELFDIIDDYIEPLKTSCEWGFSLPGMISGMYQSHPNNVLFLTNQYRISAKDVKHIISRIDPQTRERYDYDNIRRLYVEYNSSKVNDIESRETLGRLLKGSPVLVVIPGSSLDSGADAISSYVKEHCPVIISANFAYPGADYAFYVNPKRLESDKAESAKRLITSNIKSDSPDGLAFNYETLIESKYTNFENSSTMLIKLLIQCGVTRFAVAGFDGYTNRGSNYFSGWRGQGSRGNVDYRLRNIETREILKSYAHMLERPEDIRFITPSIYADIFERVEESTN
jgi:4-hydroxy 2-oxovalerate aldolase